MVVIRLARHGRHKYPTYRIVAADKRRAATGKFLAILGSYNPHTKEIKLNKEEISKYLDNGAQASDRVLRLLNNEKIELPKWAKTHDRNKKPKRAEEEKEENATAEVASDAAEAAEVKAEEIKAEAGTAKEEAVQEEAAESTEEVAKAVEETNKDQQ